MELQDLPTLIPSTCSSAPKQDRDVASPVPTLHRYQELHDNDGQLWHVRESRTTKHGFDLCLGYPVTSSKGTPSIIATPALVDYWHAHRTDFVANFDLPASRAALARLRKRLGFNVNTDRHDLWRQPIDDLRKLPVWQFADRYNIPTSTAIRWRAQLLNNLRRARGLPRDPAVQRILNSDLHHRPVAELLGVTTKHVRDLRRKIALGYQFAPEPVGAFPLKWNTPEVLATLRSNQTCAQMATVLGISPTHAQRLRASFRLYLEPAEKGA